MSRQSGRRPSARDGHSCVISNNYMLVFGGDRHQMPFNDLFLLDCETELAKLSDSMVKGLNTKLIYIYFA